MQNLWQSTALGEMSTPAAAGSRIGRLAFFGQLREGKGILIFVDALRALESDLLNGIDLLFLGRETPRWTADRMRRSSRSGVGGSMRRPRPRCTTASLRWSGRRVVGTICS